MDGKAIGEVVRDQWGNNFYWLRYTFDENNQIIGFGRWVLGDTAWSEYYFAKNLQGDVIGVYRASDNAQVAFYEYDAWGNILYKYGEMADINPFRYRTYYYDNETWFYYLQSRYYDPAIGRFINADAFVSTGQGLLGNNMFAYCNNNPVMFEDASGYAFRTCTIIANDGGYTKDPSPTSTLDPPHTQTSSSNQAENRKNGTITMGYTLSGAFGIAGSVSGGVTIDKNGNVGLAVTTNAGGGFPSVSIGNFISVTNAPTIYAQEGWGTVVGGAIGPEVISVGAEYNMLIDKDNDTVYHGGTLSIAAGFLPACAELHGEAGYTWVWGVNVFDVAKQFLGI